MNIKEKVYLFLFTALIIAAAILYIIPPKEEEKANPPVIKTFLVEPSKKKNGSIIYKNDAVITVRAQGARRLEIRYLPRDSQSASGGETLFSTITGLDEIAFPLEAQELNGYIWVRAEGLYGTFSESERVFIEYDKESEIKSIADEIEIYFPKIGEIVKSPVKVSGRALGTWFFEANLPVTLLDADRNIIAKAPFQAKDDWMTEEFVGFDGEIKFSIPKTDTGFLVVENDNPSGLPENAKSFEVPVRFR